MERAVSLEVGDVVLTPDGKTGNIGEFYSGAFGPTRATVVVGSRTLSYLLSDLVKLTDSTTTRKCPPGSKYDTAKPDWSLIQSKALDRYVRVLTFGAAKYDRENWRQVPNLRNRYLAACFRHIVAYLGGEKTDPESGEHHLAHAICCLAFVLEDIIDKGDEK